MSVQALNGNGYNHFSQNNPHINLHEPVAANNNNNTPNGIINQLIMPNVFKNGAFDPKQFLNISNNDSVEVCLPVFYIY
jgi:hypothetical protein